MKELKFNKDMAKAVALGIKTQTRRPVKGFEVRSSMPEPEWASLIRCCPYGKVGDRLQIAKPITWGEYVLACSETGRRPNPMIDLQITDISIEKLQDISEDDCFKEGIDYYEYGCGWMADTWGWQRDPVDAFNALWESIYGNGSWDKNPYVWVIKFRVI